MSKQTQYPCPECDFISKGPQGIHAHIRNRHKQEIVHTPVNEPLQLVQEAYKRLKDQQLKLINKIEEVDKMKVQLQTIENQLELLNNYLSIFQAKSLTNSSVA